MDHQVTELHTHALSSHVSPTWREDYEAIQFELDHAELDTLVEDTYGRAMHLTNGAGYEH